MLRLQFLLSDGFSFDAVLKVEPTKTSHSDPLVYELTMEQFAALLQCEPSPASESLMAKQEINMLLL